MKWALLSAVALLSGCGVPVITAAFVVIAVQHDRAVSGGSLGPPEATVVGISRAAPELAPDRRVSEQDCTKPIDWSLGNIRCK